MAPGHAPTPDAAADPPSHRGRGRPVSLRARQAVLDAAAQLLDQRGFSGFTVDEVARRSGVSKATIYKHWTGGYHLAVEAYGDTVTDAVPVISTGDAVADLASQIIRLAGFYASRRGQVIAELLAAGTAHPAGADLLREQFFARRRADTVTLIKRGQADGQLRADIDPELAIDLLFGSVVFRLFNGLTPIDTDAAAQLAHMALRALASS